MSIPWCCYFHSPRYKPGYIWTLFHFARESSCSSWKTFSVTQELQISTIHVKQKNFFFLWHTDLSWEIANEFLVDCLSIGLCGPLVFCNKVKRKKTVRLSVEYHWFTKLTIKMKWFWLWRKFRASKIDQLSGGVQKWSIWCNVFWAECTYTRVRYNDGDSIKVPHLL